MGWKQTVEERQELVLATSSTDGIPHAIVVISLGLIDKKLLLGACLMKTTLKNIQKNNKVVIIAKANGEYYRIKGTADVHPSGKYFDLAYSKSNPPMPKAAITITIEEIFDLDKQVKI
jgi:hypothetical protein